MVYDELTRPCRIAYGIIGVVLLAVGSVGTVAEVYLARSGYPPAWVAAVITAVLAALGAFLLHGARRGRIRSLGIGRNPPAV